LEGDAVNQAQEEEREKSLAAQLHAAEKRVVELMNAKGMPTRQHAELMWEYSQIRNRERDGLLKRLRKAERALSNPRKVLQAADALLRSVGYEPEDGGPTLLEVYEDACREAQPMIDAVQASDTRCGPVNVDANGSEVA
jgi:hypothetical protein